MNIEKIREDFEVWAGEYLMYSPESVRRNWDGSRYEHDALNGMWDGWTASRESLVIELPSVQCVNINEYTSCEAVGACKRAIEAAGLKVKS